MAKLKFDLVSALNVISVEEDLTKTFVSKFPFGKNDNFEKLIKNAGKGVIDTAKVNYAKGLFEHVILNDSNFSEKYSAYYSKLAPKLETTNKASKTTKASSIKVEGVKEEKVVKKNPNKVKLPKEYNNLRVMEDFNARGDGKHTDLELTVLSLTKLKNIRALLNRRCNEMRYWNEETLTVDDMRTIVATCAMVEKKLGPLTRKKAPKK